MSAIPSWAHATSWGPRNVLLSRLVTQSRGAARKVLSEKYPFYRKKIEAILRQPRAPNAPWHNAVLKKQAEVTESLNIVQTIGLYPSRDSPKNWDSLAALDCILARTDRDSRILDAGAETYSVLLPWLALYGYRDLTGVNLVFHRQRRMGPIVLEYGDITNTNYDNESFDVT
jgi:hypothetical protein